MTINLNSLSDAKWHLCDYRTNVYIDDQNQMTRVIRYSHFKNLPKNLQLFVLYVYVGNRFRSCERCITPDCFFLMKFTIASRSKPLSLFLRLDHEMHKCNEQIQKMFFFNVNLWCKRLDNYSLQNCFRYSFLICAIIYLFSQV